MNMSTNDNPNTNKSGEHLGYLLSAYLFKNLSAAGVKNVETHLQDCDQCRAELATLRQTLGLVEASFKANDENKTYVFEEARRLRVLEAARRREIPVSRLRNIWSHWGRTAVAALFLCCLIVGMMMPTYPASAPAAAEGFAKSGEREGRKQEYTNSPSSAAPTPPPQSDFGFGLKGEPSDAPATAHGIFPAGGGPGLTEQPDDVQPDAAKGFADWKSKVPPPPAVLKRLEPMRQELHSTKEVSDVVVPAEMKPVRKSTQKLGGGVVSKMRDQSEAHEDMIQTDSAGGLVAKAAKDMDFDLDGVMPDEGRKDVAIAAKDETISNQRTLIAQEQADKDALSEQNKQLAMQNNQLAEKNAKQSEVMQKQLENLSDVVKGIDGRMVVTKQDPDTGRAPLNINTISSGNVAGTITAGGTLPALNGSLLPNIDGANIAAKSKKVVSAKPILDEEVSETVLIQASSDIAGGGGSDGLMDDSLVGVGGGKGVGLGWGGGDGTGTGVSTDNGSGHGSFGTRTNSGRKLAAKRHGGLAAQNEDVIEDLSPDTKVAGAGRKTIQIKETDRKSWDDAEESTVTAVEPAKNYIANKTMSIGYGLSAVPADSEKSPDTVFITNSGNVNSGKIGKDSNLQVELPNLGVMAYLGAGHDPIYSRENLLRGYRYFHAQNANLSYSDYARRSSPVPPALLTDEGLDEDAYIARYGTRPFVDCQRDSLSTFGMDVDTASYTHSRLRLRQGRLPDPSSVRVEEFLNNFKQRYHVNGPDAFGVFVEGSPSLFVSGASGHSLDERSSEEKISNAGCLPTPAPSLGLEVLKIGIKSRQARPEEHKPAMLTFCIDTSGSMTHDNRLDLVRKALTSLVKALNPEDSVAIVGFADQAELVLPRTQAKQRQRILDAIQTLKSDGATDVESGLNMAYRMADESYSTDSVNRIVLCSDGVANIGAKGPDEILKLVKVFSERGIELSTVGFGKGQYNDQMMVKLADSGNGSSHFVDSVAAAQKIFTEQLPPHLNVLAKDAKVQVVFNPEVVERYRLLGYEKRKIADKDFRNDAIDSGDVAHDTLVTALYEIKRKPMAHGSLGKVYLRWKDAGHRHLPVVERNYPLSEGVLVGQAKDAAPEFRFLMCVAHFAELLRESPWVRNSSYAAVLEELNRLPESFRQRTDFREVIELVGLAQKLSINQWEKECK